MEIPKTLIDFLSHNKIAYEILHHPEAFTAADRRSSRTY